MITVDGSPDAMRGALHGLYGWAYSVEKKDAWAGELIEVSIKSPRGKWHASHWKIGTLLDPETLKQLAYWSTQGREVYMGCVGVTSVPDKSWRRGGAALRGHAGALWLDVDCEAPGREGTEYFGSVGAAVSGVDAALGPTLSAASLVIGSGWGVQYWIPLREPVPGREASRLVRALVGWTGEMTVKQIDRVWDTTRVMRMPGTLNWRAGPDESDARPTGVVRWPDESYRGGGRLRIGNVIDELGDVVSDVLELPRLDPELDGGLSGTGLLDALLERYAPGAGDGAYGATGGPDHPYIPLGEVLGDLDRLADETLEWADVLEPFGWRCISESGREQVWQRPGKLDEDGRDGWDDGAGDRSAVVYADKKQLLVVYSDSPATGFSSGLRGSGRRGSAAGVGVISKWRAWVDLAWAGDEDRARRCVRAAGAEDAADGSDEVAKKVGRAWQVEMNWVEDWGRQRELEAMESHFYTTVSGTADP